MRLTPKAFFPAVISMLFILSLTGYAHGAHGNDKSNSHKEISTPTPSTESYDLATARAPTSEYPEFSLEAYLLKASLKVYAKSSVLEGEEEHEPIICCVGQGCACCLAAGCGVINPNGGHYSHGACAGDDCMKHPGNSCGNCP